MTDKEKAIVMAHTGICMLAGDKFQIFHKYVEDIMGRPVMTHEIGWLADTIKEKTKADFLALCADENGSEKPNKWSPVSEGLPEECKNVIVTDIEVSDTYQSQYMGNGYWECDNGYFRNRIIAWMPLPEPYKAERSEEV